jgi:hypothetical protein
MNSTTSYGLISLPKTGWIPLTTQLAGRKAKHLMHHRGPATITKPIPGRRRQFELTFRDRTYKRDVAMIIPERTMKTIDTDTFEVTDLLIQHAKPSLYDLEIQDLTMMST